MDDTDRFELQRFVQAQEAVYAQVCAELRNGRKASHWMWFVFPQIAGLGHSQMARRYAIGSRAEALAYLQHPLLGARLRECTAFVNAIEGRPLLQVLGSPDNLKFHSCMTLFDAVAPDEPVFAAALQRWFGGTRDAGTLARL